MWLTPHGARTAPPVAGAIAVLRRCLRAAGASVAFAATTIASCSPGEGLGSVRGELNVALCWSGPFDLKPDFFAGVPFRDRAADGTARDAFQIRIQNGGDFQNFSDGLSILIDDVHAVRGDAGKPARLGQPLAVALAPGVTPPGVPITPNPDPAMVHIALYLQRSCRTQNVALYAMDAVTLNADGSCKAPALDAPHIAPCAPAAAPSDAGLPAPSGDAGSEAGADASSASGTGPIGRSSITFSHLFNGNPTEPDAAERRNTAAFRVYLADPREICPGGLGPPPRCRGFLEGSFDFYFERGRPAQPFP
jgi:hypothetical protein